MGDSKMRLLGVVGVSLLHLACGATPDEGAAEAIAPASGASVVDEGGNEIVLRDAFADGGVLTAVKSPEGVLSFAVSAPIGSDAERLLQVAYASSSLADVYLALHEDTATVPAAITTLSDELEASKLAAEEARLLAGPSDDVVVDEPDAAGVVASGAAVDKDQNGFMTGYCRNFTEGNINYRPGDHCTFYYSAQKVCNVYIYNWVYHPASDPYKCSMGFGQQYCPWSESVNSGSCAPYGSMSSNGTLMDRAYGWNANAQTATMSIWGGNPAAKNTWKPTVPPYTVSWVQWGGTYTYAQGQITLPAGLYGELGLTAHAATYAVPK
jgi:hypothetical protein